MKKQVKVQSLESNQVYLTIYEVRVQKHDGEVITNERFLNKKDAENQKEFVDENYQNLYASSWIREQMVWC